MEIQIILLSLSITLVASIDLGPYIRIAQCRSQCLRQFSVDGTCDETFNSEKLACIECWHHCEGLEYQWQTYRELCEDDTAVSNCSSCKAICDYRKTRVIEEYLPSTLPAPERSPVVMKTYDVAILMRKVNEEWKESGYTPGSFEDRLKLGMWLIVVSSDGVKHYSPEEWVPILESLKPGPLYEATISWKNAESQIRKFYTRGQRAHNNIERQRYLEKYGKFEWKGSEPVMFDYFFRNTYAKPDVNSESDLISKIDSDDEIDEDVEEKKESWVVAWEPETGGLMGNQEADSNYAQITLLPGTKYRVRVASKDGPGSFPIEVDTSSKFVQVHRLKKNSENFYAWRIFGACMSMLIFTSVFLTAWLSLKKPKKIVEIEEEVV